MHVVIHLVLPRQPLNQHVWSILWYSRSTCAGGAGSCMWWYIWFLLWQPLVYRD